MNDWRFDFDAFISYTRRGEDVGVATFVENELTKRGLSVYRDVHGIVAGDAWLEELIRALAGSRCVVAIISKESLGRDFCTAELFVGRAYSRIIPVYLPGVARNDDTVPFQIATRQDIKLDSIDWDATKLDAIAAGVEKFKSRYPTKTGFLGERAGAVEDATVRTLSTVGKWPYGSGSRWMQAQDKLRVAAETMKASNEERLRNAYLTYCDPDHIAQGVFDMLRELQKLEGDRTKEWLALGHLALPFIRDPVAKYAFRRAKLNAKQIADLTGQSVEALARATAVRPAENRRAEKQIRRFRAQALAAKNFDSAYSQEPKTKDTTAASTSRAPVITGLNAAILNIGSSIWHLLQSASSLFRRRPSPSIPVGLTDPSIVQTKSNIENSVTRRARRKLPAGATSALRALPLIIALLVSSSAFRIDQTPDGLPPPANDVVADKSGEVLPWYCATRRTCDVPPGGYSLSRVAQDCYGNDVLAMQLWKLNESSLTEQRPGVNRNADLLWPGEIIRLTSEICRADLTGAFPHP